MDRGASSTGADYEVDSISRRGSKVELLQLFSPIIPIYVSTLLYRSTLLEKCIKIRMGIDCSTFSGRYNGLKRVIRG